MNVIFYKLRDYVGKSFVLRSSFKFAIVFEKLSKGADIAKNFRGMQVYGIFGSAFYFTKLFV